jgi:hypothetical protein
MVAVNIICMFAFEVLGSAFGNADFDMIFKKRAVLAAVAGCSETSENQ